MNEHLNEKFLERGNILRQIKEMETNHLYLHSTKIDNMEVFDLHFDEMKIPVNYVIDENNKLWIEMDNFSDFMPIGKTREEEVEEIKSVTELLKCKKSFNDLLEEFEKEEKKHSTLPKAEGASSFAGSIQQERLEVVVKNI